MGQPSSAPGTAITEADILLPPPPSGEPAFGPLARPQIFLTGGQLALSHYAGCVGHQGGDPCGIEVDALSYGTDAEFCNPPALLPQTTRLFFSVDEQAIGHPLDTHVPSVRSEAAAGVREVSSDIFAALDLPGVPPLAPPPPTQVPTGNVGTIDGDGLVSGSGSHYRGIGLKEPNPPGPPPDPGDNLDALDLSPLPPPNGFVYFSLDAAFNDPVVGVPNSGSAAAHSVPPAAVLRKQINTGAFTVWATPSQLGLDILGAGTDDLDALVLFENGDGVFEPSAHPYDWGSPCSGSLLGARDMLLFSVRRGSAVVGMPDSIFGAPIEPGDVLTTPLAGGVSPFPGIFIAAEHLGLATSRSGLAANGDDMDAMAAKRVPFYDCNMNSVEDSVDIATEASDDDNDNGIPDECERNFAAFCLCPSTSAPCSNDDPTAGCENSTGNGGLLAASGTTSYAEDDLVLTATQLPANKLGLWLISGTQVQVVLGDGLRCYGNPVHRFGSFNSGPSGTGVKGPGIIASSCATLPAAYCIDPGATWNFQIWYRNLTGPCGSGTNLTNAMEVTFTP